MKIFSSGVRENGALIPSIQALNDAIADGNNGYAISLNGALVSRKTIARSGAKYSVINHIDGTKQTLNGDQLYDRRYSNIGEAMQKDALIVYA